MAWHGMASQWHHRRGVITTEIPPLLRCPCWSNFLPEEGGDSSSRSDRDRDTNASSSLTETEEKVASLQLGVLLLRSSSPCSRVLSTSKKNDEDAESSGRKDDDDMWYKCCCACVVFCCSKEASCSFMAAAALRMRWFSWRCRSLIRFLLMLLWLCLGIGSAFPRSSATGCNRRMFDWLLVLVVVLDAVAVAAAVAAAMVSRERLLLVAAMVNGGYNAVMCGIRFGIILFWFVACSEQCQLGGRSAKWLCSRNIQAGIVVSITRLG